MSRVLPDVICIQLSKLIKYDLYHYQQNFTHSNFFISTKMTRFHSINSNLPYLYHKFSNRTFSNASPVISEQFKAVTVYIASETNPQGDMLLLSAHSVSFITC